ncbi:hypothetical protein DA803_02010 [[Mycoplasma] phocae]|uniref:Lipoprotein n=1 Tax=[Mycoplasma] phocae TaxID=142651 RepID=A0A2Z5ISQ4_9BACT|nr:hypothetical protein [[Mycoplasma] phocae]AXE60858.1 hypothetical protein DA803_02010 [[Mycoplasma] phocae]
MKKKNFKWWIALPVAITTLPLVAAACDQNNNNEKKETKPITDGSDQKITTQDNGIKKDPMTNLPMTDQDGKMGEKDKNNSNPVPPTTKKEEGKKEDTESKNPQTNEGKKDETPKPPAVDKDKSQSDEQSSENNSSDSTKNDSKTKSEEKLKKEMELQKQILDKKNKIKQIIKAYSLGDELTKELEVENNLEKLNAVESKALEEVSKRIKQVLENENKLDDIPSLIQKIKNLDSSTSELVGIKEKTIKEFYLEFIKGLESKNVVEFMELQDLINKNNSNKDYSFIEKIYNSYNSKYSPILQLIKKYNLETNYKKQIDANKSFSQLYDLKKLVDEFISKIKTIKEIKINSENNEFTFQLSDGRKKLEKDKFQIFFKQIDEPKSNESIIAPTREKYNDITLEYTVKFMRRKGKNKNIKSKIYLLGVQIEDQIYIIPDISLDKILEIRKNENFESKNYPELKYVLEID